MAFSQIVKRLEAIEPGDSQFVKRLEAIEPGDSQIVKDH
jgi:hypothetical protein